MKVSTTLAASTALLLVAQGAYAADAVVVAEPEPAEYVKICDVYGAGYFYIPGTETCLRVGGYVRLDIAGGDAGHPALAVTKAHDRRTGERQGTWTTNGRFSLKTWTAQETELGTLKTFAESRASFGNRFGTETTGLDLTLNYAWIQLGGLRVGKTDSNFAGFVGYAGNVMRDTMIPTGSGDTNQISYTFDAGNGFSAIVAAEQGSGGWSRLRRPGDTWVVDNNTVDSYLPHMVGGIKYTQGWGSIAGVVAYNSNYEEWSGKVRLDLIVNKALTLWVMGAYGSDKNIDRNFYKPWGGNWAIWGGGAYRIDEKTVTNLQISADDAKNVSVAANVSRVVVPGFTVTGEVDFLHDGNFGTANNSSWPVAYKKNGFGGMVRFQRDF